MFGLFDKLLLLAHGRVVYFGPSRDIVHYFTSSIYKFPYTPGYNPADFLSNICFLIYIDLCKYVLCDVT